MILEKLRYLVLLRIGLSILKKRRTRNNTLGKDHFSFFEDFNFNLEDYDRRRFLSNVRTKTKTLMLIKIYLQENRHAWTLLQSALKWVFKMKRVSDTKFCWFWKLKNFLYFVLWKLENNRAIQFLKSFLNALVDVIILVEKIWLPTSLKQVIIYYLAEMLFGIQLKQRL